MLLMTVNSVIFYQHLTGFNAARGGLRQLAMPF
jgi:hypothetical protein